MEESKGPSLTHILKAWTQSLRLVGTPFGRPCHWDKRRAAFSPLFLFFFSSRVVLYDTPLGATMDMPMPSAQLPPVLAAVRRILCRQMLPVGLYY